MAIPKTINIDGLREKIEGAKTVINEYMGIPADIMNYKLNPETWSCTEVCQHLIKFNKLYMKEADQSLQKLDVAPAGNGPFSPRWVVRKMAGYFEPPYKIKINTLKPMYPSNPELSNTETITRLLETEEEMLGLINKAEQEKWNIDEIKSNHPIFKYLKMSITDVLILIDAHQRRHFWQIEQILKRIPTD